MSTIREDGQKVCGKCITPKPLSDFSRDVRNGRTYYRYICYECDRRRGREYYSKNAESRRLKKREERKLKPERGRVRDSRGLFHAYKYGISLDEYATLFHKQGGVCSICKTPPKDGRRLSIDHDHRCCATNDTKRMCGKCIRSLLCHECNTALGFAKDDPDLLRRMATYIESFLERKI